MTPAAPAWRRYLRFRGADVRADVDDELAFHLEIVAAAYVAQGENPDRAMRRARQEFGNVDQAKVQCYRIGERRRRRFERGEWFTALGQDVRYSIRSLSGSPAFTLGVAAMMALAIAANAAMFAVLDRMFVRAPAYLVSPATTHRVYHTAYLFDTAEGPGPAMSYYRYEDLRRWSHAFSEIAASNEREMAVGDGARSELARVARVSGSMWKMFNARPLLGRFPTEREDQPGPSSLIAILGYDYWRSRFDADSEVIGQTIHVGGRLYEIAGVAPPKFVGMSQTVPAVFVPLEAAPPDMFFGRGSLTSEYNSAWIEVVARRKRGWSMRDATNDLAAALRRSLQQQEALGAMPPRGSPAAVTLSARGTLAPVLTQQGPLRTDEARVALWLGGVAGVLLLIAALNVANLMLARTLRRQREIALRVALGATVGRLVRLLMAEAAILMMTGTVAGLAALWWFGEGARQALLPNVSLPRISIDARVVAFAIGSAVVVTMIIALTPALHAGGWNVASAINENAHGGSRRRARTRAIILVAQAALSLALCVTAGLFVRSLYNVRALPMGYDPRHVLTLTPIRGAVGSTTATELTDDLMRRARSVDEATDVAESMSLPFTVSMMRRIVARGADAAALGSSTILYNAVSPSYFSTVGTRIVQGRAFTEGDSAGAEPVAVVSAPMAGRLWPNKNAIGQCLVFNEAAQDCIRIVGIAEGTRHWSYQRDAMLDYYVPLSQVHASSVNVLVRTTREASAVKESVRRRLQPSMPAGVVLKVASMQDGLDKAAAPWRVGATLLSLFAALAFVIAVLGVYATTSYDLTERQHEIGIRLALGATRADLARSAVMRGLGIAVLGVAMGTVLSLVVSSVLSTLLFGVSSRDPETFVTAVAAITLASLAALATPALRAARADPSNILRSG